MNLEATALSDALLWLRGSGLEIVLLVVGAVLLTRFATWLGGLITDRIDASAARDRRARALRGGQAPARRDPGDHLGVAGRSSTASPPC